MSQVREHTRIDNRRLPVYQAIELFKNEDFKDPGTDLFSDEDLDLFIENILQGGPIPYFGAKEDELGCPHFKSGKFYQVVNKLHEKATSGEMSQLQSHKIRCGIYIPFVTISEGAFYNPGITQDQIKKLLHFYL